MMNRSVASSRVTIAPDQEYESNNSRLLPLRTSGRLSTRQNSGAKQACNTAESDVHNPAIKPNIHHYENRPAKHNHFQAVSSHTLLALNQMP
jgi:hypothetical protein